MLERNKIYGLGTEEEPNGLIIPVVFADGKYFPPEAKAIQYQDFRKWNTHSPSFKRAKNYVKFDKAVQKLCDEIAKCILTAPSLKSIKIPETEKKSLDKVSFSLPRLK